VDVKFTTIDLLAGGDLGNGGSQPAYKIQLFLYDRALARIQGTARTTSYLLGRGWRQTIEGDERRGANAFERLGPFPADGTLARGAEPERVAGEACAWIRLVRREGAGWDVLPEPSRDELRPNLANKGTAPGTPPSGGSPRSWKTRRSCGRSAFRAGRPRAARA
jgi:hypothetical protein